MQKTLSILMNGIVDYAGLFPPAKLSLYDAVHEFRRHREHAHAAILARFVVPVAQLTSVHQEVGDFISTNVTKVPWNFSVLATPQKTAESFLESFESDIRDMKKFLNRYRQGEAIIDSCEVLLPDDLAENPSVQNIVLFLLDVKDILGELPGLPRLFFEVPYRKNKVLEKISTAFSQHNKQERHTISAKLRTGGLTPEAIPSAEQLANAIVTLKENRVAFKATASLHQPLRHFDNDVGAEVFGFFNLWGAATAAWTQNANLGQVTDILLATKLSYFQFLSEKASAGEFCFAADDIFKTRSQFALSFGSCSFLEPLECLKNLELL